MLKSYLSFLYLLQWVASSRSDPCTLCKSNNSNIILSYEKELNFVAANKSLIHNCTQLETYVAVLEAGSQECVAYQSIGTLCGCPEPENACNFCSSFHEMDNVRHTAEFPFTQSLPFNPTCEMVQAIGKHYFEADTHKCQRELQFYSYLCGCPFIFQKQQNILKWLPRVSATMSFLGSAFIVQDILKSRKKHVMTYHQIIISMSIVDMLSSIAWALSIIPLPPSEEFGASGGAKGNHATCKAQGFFIEFGLTSPFFNLALSIYYVLVIKYGWKEDRVSKKRPYLLGLPLLCGLGIAFAGIPHYGPDIVMCYVDQSADDSYILPLVFLFLPIFLVILFSTIAVIIVYWSVRQKERASRRWTMRTDHHPSLERKVFWQSLWYLASFYVSWPVVIIVPFVDTQYYRAYWYLCLVIFLAPLQGFLNFLVYTHPRLQQQHFLRRISSTIFHNRLKGDGAAVEDEMGRSSMSHSEKQPPGSKESKEPIFSIRTPSDRDSTETFAIQEPSAYIAK